MTSISGNSAALSILTQTSTLPAANKSAADTILDIVSGGSTGAANKAEEARLAKLAAQKAKIAALDQPREAGGTVSSEISAGWTSAMSTVVQGTTLASAPVETQDATQGTTGTAPVETAGASADPWDAAIEAATKRAVISVGTAVALNAKFNQVPTIDLEATLSGIETQRQQKIAAGQNEEAANKAAAQSVRSTTAAAAAFEKFNAGIVERSNNMSVYYNDIVETHGVSGSVTVDASGKATVGAFEISDDAGRKLVSLGEDGTLTTYNSDGSVRSKMDRKETALATMVTGNDYVNLLSRRGVDLNSVKLY